MLAIARRAVLALPVLLLAISPDAATWAQPASQSVRLVIDYGDGVVKIFDRLPWSNGEKVIDALNAAHAGSHGITFAYTGSGATALLTKIDDVQNQGGGSAGKNWQYWVNTTYADRGFAVYPVQPEDTVFWRYATDERR